LGMRGLAREGGAGGAVGRLITSMGGLPTTMRRVALGVGRVAGSLVGGGATGGGGAAMSTGLGCAATERPSEGVMRAKYKATAAIASAAVERTYASGKRPVLADIGCRVFDSASAFESLERSSGIQGRAGAFLTKGNADECLTQSVVLSFSSSS